MTRPTDVLGVVLVLPVLLLLDLMLAMCGVVRVQRWLSACIARTPGDSSGPSPTDPRDNPQLLALVMALDRAGRRYRVNGRCLRRSLVLWCWLTAKGFESEVVLGVRRTPDGLMGHAWVVWQGSAILEPSDLTTENVSFVSMGKKVRS